MTLSSAEDPSATATGTISIKVADSNDHCPTLTSTHSSLCAERRTVYLTARDEDASPNAAPFTFTIIPEGSQGSWDIEVINGERSHAKSVTCYMHLSRLITLLWPQCDV